MLKNAATALGKSSVRQIKTNGPKLKWLYGQERLRWDKKKQQQQKKTNSLLSLYHHCTIKPFLSLEFFLTSKPRNFHLLFCKQDYPHYTD